MNLPSAFSKCLREPLVHFVILGAALFALGAVVKSPVASPASHIVVTPGIIENLEVGFQRSSRRPPTAADLDQLIDGYVREEILIREANAMGLPHDDPTVRTWLVQRMEFLNEDSAGIALPTDAELGAYLATLGDSFRNADGTMPAVADIRDQLSSLWMAEHRRAAGRKAYEELRKQYTVEVRKSPASPTPASTP